MGQGKVPFSLCRSLEIVVTFFCLLFVLIPRTPSTSDGVHFLLGVESFDLDLMQPHFPGYPIYMGLAKLFSLVLTPSWSLAFINSIGAIIFLWCLTKLTKLPFYVIVLLTLSSALFLIDGLQFGSDMLGLAIWSILIFVCLKPSPSLYLCGFLGGVLLGARLGYAPLLSVLWIPLSQNFKRSWILLLGLCSGVLTWLVPLIEVVGWNHYFQIGQQFIFGHFNSWGNSVISKPDPIWRLTELLIFFKKNILFVSLIGILFLLAPKMSFDKQKMKKWSLVLGPYALFVVFGQNFENHRHFLPFLLIFILMVSYFLKQLESFSNYYSLLRGVALAGAPAARRLRAPWGRQRQDPGRVVNTDLKNSLTGFKRKVIVSSCIIIMCLNVIHCFKVNTDQPAPLKIIAYLDGLKGIEQSQIWAGESKAFMKWRRPHWTVYFEPAFDEMPNSIFPVQDQYFIADKNLGEMFSFELELLKTFKKKEKMVYLFKKNNSDPLL